MVRVCEFDIVARVSNVTKIQHLIVTFFFLQNMLIKYFVFFYYQLEVHEEQFCVIWEIERKRLVCYYIYLSYYNENLSSRTNQLTYYDIYRVRLIKRKYSIWCHKDNKISDLREKELFFQFSEVIKTIINCHKSQRTLLELFTQILFDHLKIFVKWFHIVYVFMIFSTCANKY